MKNWSENEKEQTSFPHINEPNYCWPHLTLAKKCPINQSCVLLQRFSCRPLPLFISRLYMLDILHAVCPPQHWSTVSGSVSSLAARQCPWPNNSDTDWTISTPNLLSSPTLYNVRELRITWPSSVLCHFQRNAFVMLGAFSWNRCPVFISVSGMKKIKFSRSQKAQEKDYHLSGPERKSANIMSACKVDNTSSSNISI